MTKRLFAKILVFALAVAGLSFVAPTAALAAVTTTTTLTVSPEGSSPQGTQLTLSASVSNAPAGRVTFFLDGAPLGQEPRPVGNGQAVTTLVIEGARTHTLYAAFQPTNADDFAPSRSSDVTYKVTPDPNTNTKTALSASPPSPITEGTNPTLTATIDRLDVAGTVVFYDGLNAINPEDPEPVQSNGKASVVTSLEVGTHELTAEFTPEDLDTYQPSTSPAITYVVNAAAPTATQTTTTLEVSPASPAPAGSTQTMTATVSPASAKGTVTFKDGTTTIGDGTVNQSGKVVVTGGVLTPGSHSLTATFTPTDAAAFTSSTSEVTAYTVSPKATPTSVSLTAAPASPQEAGTSITFTASITPKAAEGTVQLRDGTTAIGEPSTVVNGSAQVQTSALTKGTHSLTVVFTPSDTSVYDPSTSTAITYVIASRPSVPTNIVGKPGNASATVTWTKPTDDGGTPITGYALQQSTSGGESWTDTAPGGTRTSTATSKVVTGLTNGVGYLFRVAAINGIGNSQYAQTTAEVTPVLTTITIGGTPTSTTYGTKVTVTGTIKNSTTNTALSGAQVRLYQRQVPATTFSLVATYLANSAGVVSAARTATASTYYQWRYVGTATQSAADSPIRLMSTSYVVSAGRTPATVARGQSAKVYGFVAGGTSGTVVYLQRYLGGTSYSTLASTTVKYQTLPNGQKAVGYSFTTQLASAGTYNFRTYVPTGPSLLIGYSPLQAVRAT